MTDTTSYPKRYGRWLNHPQEIQTPNCTLPSQNQTQYHQNASRDPKKTEKNTLPKSKASTPTTTDPQHTEQTQTQARKVLQLPDSSKLEDISALCNKAIANIINKASRKLVDSLRKKEDQLYKKSPKRYHNNLKTAIGIQPNGKDQPKL